MRRLISLQILSLIVLYACCAGALAQPTPSRGGGLPFEDFGNEPDPLATDPGPAGEDSGPSLGGRGAEGAEELAIPEGVATEPTEEEASRLVQYNSIENPWLPVEGSEPQGWLAELQVPENLLNCKCDGKVPGECCRVWRSFQKPTHPSIDQECVSCVKEPYLSYTKVHYTVDAVVEKCFESKQPFCDKGCEDGRCIERRGTKTVRQLQPCTASVKLFYWKPIVKYRDVYYYINCEPCHEGDQAIAMNN